MKDLLFVFTDYLKGNPVYPEIRRDLNLILNINISSFLYEKIIGKYTWIEILDYKSILDFFVKGNFIIPLSLYVLTYSTIAITAFLFFDLRLNYKKIIATERIKSNEWDKERFDEMLESLTKFNLKFKVASYSKEKIILFYKNKIRSASKNDIDEIEKLIEIQKRNLSTLFSLIYKMLIAVIIYYFSLSNFPLGLFASALIIFGGIIFLIIMAYRLIDILPTLHEYLNNQVDEYNN